MKKVLLYILGILLYLLIPCIFASFGAFVFFSFLKPQMDAGKLLKTGTETVATVIDMDSNLTITEQIGPVTTKQRQYRLKIRFIDSAGNEIEYKTASIYSEDFIREMGVSIDETIQIIYSGKRAVVKDFKPVYKTILWVFPIAFGLIALATIVFLFVYLKWDITSHIIEKTGTLSMGTFVKKKGLFKNQNPNVYKITFVFMNENNETLEAETGYLYNDEDVEQFKKMGQFPIFYKGKNAVIVKETK